MALDERLRRELERAARPADPSGVYEDLIRRRERRRVVRKIEGGALALVVVAGCLAGVYALSRVFDPSSGGRPGTQTGSGDRITYVTYESSDPGDSSSIFTANPDGSDPLQLLEHPELVTDLDWSPDGRRLVYGRGDLFVFDLDTGQSTRLAGPNASAPSWSPDGSQIAFAVDRADLGQIVVVNADGTGARIVTEAGSLGWTDWSPDGSRILFVGPGPDGAHQGWDIYVTNVDGSDVTNLTNSPTVDLDPSWSPDGSTILFRSRRDPPPDWTEGDAPDEIYLMALDGTDVRRLTHDSARDQNPVWSPDGSMIAYTSQCCEDESAIIVMNTDGTDPRRLPINAIALAWQPAPNDSGTLEPIPSVAPSPEPSPSPDLAEGAIDIGIGFPVCFAEQLGRIDYLGDGADGSAWTGIPAKDDGTCPEFPAPEKFLIAADHTGDGIADSWIDLPFACHVGCQPVDATDLDASGTEELVVTSLFTIMDYHFFTVVTDGSGELRIQPILVADPGHEPAGIAAGEPLRIDAGGDAGYGSAIECEGYPSDPVIVWSWSYSEVESGDPIEVHVTRLELHEDGLFHVVAATDTTVPEGESTGISNQAEQGPECGVDWYP